MITQILFTIIFSILGLFLNWLPLVTELPFGLDNLLQNMVGYYQSAMITVPYLEVVWECFLWIISFEIVLLIAKFAFGNRLPSNSHN